MPKRVAFLFLFSMISALSIIVFSSTVKFEILSHPSNADIFVNKVWRGMTPQVLTISPGKYQVRVEKFGYDTSEIEADLKLSTVSEFNLNPLKEISASYPIVVYLVNYQSAGDRTSLYKEQEKDLVQAIWNRFTNLGFNITVETPRDEFDLVLDKESIYLDIEKKYPQTGLFFFVEALWTFTSFQQKRVTRLDMSLKVYDPKSKITLGTFNDSSQSVGLLSPGIVVLEIVEKMTQNFLDNIGNFLVQLYTRQTKTPVLIAKKVEGDTSSFTLKNLLPIESLEVYDSNTSIMKSEITTSIDSGINILFVIDRSGSNTKYADVIKEQIDSMLSNLPKKIKWGILAFDDKVEVIQSFTEDYSRWAVAKEKITVAGMTRLYDGLYNAAKILEREKGINVIVLMTDGIDADYLDSAPGSIKTMKEAVDELKTAGSIVYPIGISEKNYTTFLRDLSLEFGTFFSDSFRQDNKKIAADILQDLLQTTVLVKTKRIDNPSFLINARKYRLAPNGRLLFNDESIEIDVAKAVLQTISQEASATVLVDETRYVTPSIQETPSTVSVPTIAATKTTSAIVGTPLATQTTSVQTPRPSDPVVQTVTQPEKTPDIATVSGSETPKGVLETSSALATVSTTVSSTTVSATQDVQAAFDTQTTLQWPENYRQILELRFSELFDLDETGNFIWTERSTAYLWIREQMKLIGIDVRENPIIINMKFPYLALVYTNRVELVKIEKEVIRCYELGVVKPVSDITLNKEGKLAIGYKDGQVQVYDLSGNKLKEFTVENSPIQKLVFDDQNRLLFLASSQKVGWVNLGADPQVYTKEMTRPIIDIAAFLIDKARFIVVDAGGDVYYLRFSDFSEQKRNLSRGIVLQSEFAEDQNQLLTVHWDKTLRVFRIYDLKETSTIQSKSMVRAFKTDSSARSIAIQAEDKTIYLGIQGNENLPSFIEAYYEIVSKAASVQEKIVETTTTQVVKPVVSGEVTQIATPQTSSSSPDVVSTPLVDTVIKEPELLFAQDVKTTMNLVYGYWEFGVSYKEFGYFLTTNGNFTWLNLLLEKQNSYDLQPGMIKDIDISRNGLIGLLLEDRVELWDAKYMSENPKVSTYKGMKYALPNGERIRFSRSGRKLLIALKDGKVALLNADYTGLKMLDLQAKITSITTDFSQADQFIVGTEQGELIWLSESEVLTREKVSNNPITQILWANTNTYWADSSGSMAILRKKEIKLDAGIVTALYAPDNGKNWVVVGSSIGNLYIYSDDFSKTIGKASLGDSTVTTIRGSVDNMITINQDRSLRSWNVSQLGLVSSKPPLKNVLGMYTDGATATTIGFVSPEGNHYLFDTVKEIILTKKLDVGTSKVEQFEKKPPVIRIKDSFYAMKNYTLGDKAFKPYENTKVNTAEVYLLFWLGDLLKVIDLDTGTTVRTLKFGELSVVTWATMVNKRLIFFLEGKMGIVNPYKPEDLLIIDVTSENFAKILNVFIFQDRLILVDQKGMVHQFGMLDSKFYTPINLSQPLTKIYYNTSRLLLIGFYENKIIRYSSVDNSINVDTVRGMIKDIDWTTTHFYALTTDGTLWSKAF